MCLLITCFIQVKVKVCINYEINLSWEWGLLNLTRSTAVNSAGRWLIDYLIKQDQQCCRGCQQYASGSLDEIGDYRYHDLSAHEFEVHNFNNYKY